MLRSVISLTKSISNLAINRTLAANPRLCNSLVSSTVQRHFSIFQPKTDVALLSRSRLDPTVTTSRTLIKYSIRKGKRKTVKTVLKRFYRLSWGGWIRRRAGCHKRLWKKTSANKRRLRQHVLCNSTQSRMLDKMVNKYWRRPRFYVDDPYAPYHTREEYKFTITKPRPYFPPEGL